MNQLYDKLTQNGLMTNCVITLEVSPNGQTQTVDKETFNGYFGETDGTYAQLVKVGEPLGYKPFFDEWKAKGIL